MFNILAIDPSSFRRRWFPTPVSYGYLYNWYAVADVRGIANGDYDVLTDAEWTWLTDYIDTNYNVSPNDFGVGNHLKSCRQVNSPLGGECATTEHPRWDEHGTEYGRDSVGFHALPGGSRYSDDGKVFIIGEYGIWWSSTEFDTNTAWYRLLYHDLSNVLRSNRDKRWGFSVRLIRPATPAEKAALADGDFVEIYTGNDGKEYATIYIGENDVGDGYVIMSSNLAETKFADLSDIPNVTDDTEWTNLTTAGRCAYDNNEDNV